MSLKGTRMKRTAFILVILLTLATVGSTLADQHVETVATFDAAAGEFPEGIASDRQGNLYVSLAPLGQIWKIAPGGDRSLFATLVDPSELPLPLGALGVAVDAHGDVYAALASFDPDTHGVWRIDQDDSPPERLAGSEAIMLPNGLAFGRHHDLYVTDSLLGAVWRLTPGQPAQLWLQHDLLTGTSVPELELPIGVNGIAFLHGNRGKANWPRGASWTSSAGALYVANTTEKHVVRIPIDKQGNPGNPKVVVAFDGPADYLDGIVVDVHGNLYPVIIGRSTLVRVSRDGAITTLATAEDGLDFPASLTFGRGASRELFITNFAVFPSPDPQRPGPGVVRVDIGDGSRLTQH